MMRFGAFLLLFAVTLREAQDKEQSIRRRLIVELDSRPQPLFRLELQAANF